MIASPETTLISAAGMGTICAMAAKYILAVLAVAFLTAALIGLARRGGTSRPQTNAWLLTGTIFAVVSAFLFYQG
jgi:hypothetical protein